VKHICKRLRGLLSHERLDVLMMDTMKPEEVRTTREHVGGCLNCQETVQAIKERGVQPSKLILEKHGF
jgi:hypothetical protein